MCGRARDGKAREAITDMLSGGEAKEPQKHWSGKSRARDKEVRERIGAQATATRTATRVQQGRRGESKVGDIPWTRL